MSNIRVVFYEIAEDSGESNMLMLISFHSESEPSYKEGSTVAVLETNFTNEIDTKHFDKLSVDATHEIATVRPPVIVWTKDPTTGDNVFTSKIYIYDLKRLNRNTSLQDLSSMLF